MWHNNTTGEIFLCRHSDGALAATPVANVIKQITDVIYGDISAKKIVL
jgi:hypothetical protein